MSDDAQIQALLEAIAIDMGRPLSEFSEFEKSQLTQWLTDVTQEIDERLNGAPPKSQATYDRVRRMAVALRASRPDFGVTSTEVGVDDARVVTRFERATGASLMRDEWWEALGLLHTAKSSFSISPAYSPDRRWSW